MMEQQVVAMAEVDQLPVVARLRFESMIRGLDEDFRFVPGGPQHPLNAEDFVADGVAVSQRRKDLVKSDDPFTRTAGPVGSFARTSCAAGRSCLRRSSQPGVG